MKKLLLTTIMCIMFFGCSKMASTEPITETKLPKSILVQSDISQAYTLYYTATIDTALTMKLEYAKEIISYEKSDSFWKLIFKQKSGQILSIDSDLSHSRVVRTWY